MAFSWKFWFRSNHVWGPRYYFWWGYKLCISSSVFHLKVTRIFLQKWYHKDFQTARDENDDAFFELYYVFHARSDWLFGCKYATVKSTWPLLQRRSTFLTEKEKNKKQTLYRNTMSLVLRLYWWYQVSRFSMRIPAHKSPPVHLNSRYTEVAAVWLVLMKTSKLTLTCHHSAPPNLVCVLNCCGRTVLVTL